MKRLLIYLSCFLLVGGGGTLLQSCEAWEVPAEKMLSVGEGLVAYLPFTRGSLKDSLAKNDTRRRNDAVWWVDKQKPLFVKGFSSTKGDSDSAIYLNGMTDFIKILDNPSLQFDTTFSISLWISPEVADLEKDISRRMQIYNKSDFITSLNESYSSSIRTIITTVDSGTGTTLMILANVKQGDNCTKAGQGWKDLKFIINAKIIESDTWHHIVFTYNRTTASMYLDGNLLDVYADGNKVLTAGRIDKCAGGDLRFGIQNLGSNGLYANYFHGAMDEIRIYNRQLNDEEVRTLFGLKQ